MKNDSVIVEETYNAPVEEVWKAITDNSEMKKWYFDIKDFQPKPGFEFNFYGGDEEKQFLHLCRITEVIPNKKLAHSWRYDGYEGNTLVTFELSPQQNSTTLKLTHEGFDSFPDLPAFKKENFKTGWTSILGESLKNFLEGKDQKKVKK
jgi:uncharacterized protein YndB with AHSA1/START domain